MKGSMLAAALLVGCGVAENDVQHRVDAITGGVIDDGGYPEAVVLQLVYYVDGGVETATICSGTLVTPRVVMTAAHCLDDSPTTRAPLRQVLVSGRSPRPAYVDPSWVPAESWRYLPGWQPQNLRYLDIGAVRLKAPLAGVTPAPFLSRHLEPHDIGRLMDVVGYGRTTMDDPIGQGVRRLALLPLRNLTTDHIELGDLQSTGVCVGDSGGPSFITDRDGVRRVAGVHSWTWAGANCTNGLDTRVDLYRAFLREFIMQAGDASCAEDGLCVQGCAADPDCQCAADGVCGDACKNPLNDPDCPLSCGADGFCSTLECVERDPDCVPERSTCTADAQCEFRTCANDARRNEHYCSRPCHQSCPDGTGCAEGVCLIPYVPTVTHQAFVAQLPAAPSCTSVPGTWVLGALALALRRARSR